jgi:hypothetical protein
MAGKPGKSETRPDPQTIGELKPDPHNRRRRTARGVAMLTESLRQVGAARSIVIDESDEVLAGNGVLEAAHEAGITKVQVVEAEGDTIIAVRRRGLTGDQKRSLALFDNRTAELAEWNPEQLADDVANSRGLTPFFNDAELKKIFKTDSPATAVVSEVQTGEVQDRFWIAVEGPLKSQAQALLRLREVMREVDGVTVELGTTPSEQWDSRVR